MEGGRQRLDSLAEVGQEEERTWPVNCPGQDDCCPLVLTPAYKTPAQSCSLQIGFDLKHKKVKMNLKANCS